MPIQRTTDRFARDPRQTQPMVRPPEREKEMVRSGTEQQSQETEEEAQERVWRETYGPGKTGGKDGKDGKDGKKQTVKKTPEPEQFEAAKVRW
jgi:hypothetical protein